MLHKAYLFAILFIFVTLPGSGVSQAAPGSAVIGNTAAARSAPEQAFAPGQVLVRFKSDTSLKAAAALVAPHGATPLHRIADHTFALSVPVGQEEQMVKLLTSDPAVQYASLNYRIVESPVAPLKPVIDKSAPQAGETLVQEPSSCITDLWMSTSRDGQRPPDNMVPSGTSQVYVFFEYIECDLEAVKIQVVYQGVDTNPYPFFNEEGFIISGSGLQGVKVPAWPYFERGVFPVGRYLTLIYISPEGGWDKVKEIAWRVSTFPNDHWFRGSSNYQWPLHSTGRRALPEADINAPQAWDITTGSSEFMIAVISTGVNIEHPDLKNKIWTNPNEIPGNGIDDDENGCVDDIHGCEFFNGEANPDPTDVGGWGTFISGIAAAETNNEIGMAGVSWGARIMPIRVLRLFPGNILGGYIADMITAIGYALDNGAQIIHLAPGVENENIPAEKLELLRAAIDDAVARGAIVIAGTGDLGEDHLLYPSGFENVVAVGATGLRNERTWFSNYGPGIDFVAPGDLILSTCGSREYCIGHGTSLAAAHVDGVAALIWSVNPDLSPAEVRRILQESAIGLGPPGYDEEYGYGKLDAAQALMQTPHHLWLRTANLDQFSLVFLLDDQANHTCQGIWNRGTGSQTWALESNANWLTTEHPIHLSSSPVPSDIQVCADAESLAGYGSFDATLEAVSRLPRHEDPVEVNALVIYQPNLSRVRLSFIRRATEPNN